MSGQVHASAIFSPRLLSSLRCHGSILQERLTKTTELLSHDRRSPVGVLTTSFQVTPFRSTCLDPASENTKQMRLCHKAAVTYYSAEKVVSEYLEKICVYKESNIIVCIQVLRGHVLRHAKRNFVL